MGKTSRHELRTQVFRLLFRVEFNNPEEMNEQMKLFFDDLEYPDCKGTLNEEESAQVQEKYEKIMTHLSEIDAKINEKAENWTTERMGKVELTILRLAVYEILFDEAIPEGVAINEAVELAKTFGQDNSGAFVNGVLAKVVAK